MDDLLDLGEERRRSSATSVRTDAGGLGPGSGGWGGATPPARLPGGASARPGADGPRAAPG